MLYDSKILIFTVSFYTPSHCIYFDCKYEHKYQKLRAETKLLTRHSLLWVCGTTNMSRQHLGPGSLCFFLLQHNFFFLLHPLQSANLCYLPVRVPSKKENRSFTGEHKHTLSKGNCPGLFAFRSSIIDWALAQKQFSKKYSRPTLWEMKTVIRDNSYYVENKNILHPTYSTRTMENI